MEIKLDRLNNESVVTSNKIEIKLTDDVDYIISINQFNELVVQKQQYGDGESAIVLKPSVSNEIRLS